MVWAKTQIIWGKVGARLRHGRGKEPELLGARLGQGWGMVGAWLGHGWGMVGAKTQITWGKVGARLGHGWGMVGHGAWLGQG